MHKPHFGHTGSGKPLHKDTLDYHKPGFNKKIAAVLTARVGSMPCFWWFNLLALLSLPATFHLMAVIPLVYHARGLLKIWNFCLSYGWIFLVTWVCQNYIQLVLLPALLVGGNLAAAASDARFEKQIENTEEILRRLSGVCQSLGIDDNAHKTPPAGSIGKLRRRFVSFILGGHVTIIDGADAVGSNFAALAALPAGTQMAGYATGSDGVAWTAAQFAAYPGALRIDQDPSASIPTADILDVENGAATPADCPGWAKNALASFRLGARPGQRSPAIYASKDNLTPVANALIAGGITAGIGLLVADWTNSRDDAVAMLDASGGPFPVVGVQYSSLETYDLDVFLMSWLVDVSTSEAPPGQWADASAWTWQSAVITGTGLDGKTHAFTYDPATGQWAKTE